MKVVNTFLKWLALLVFSISAALLVIILLASRPTMDYFWLRLSILAAVALIGSLAARLMFHRWPGVFLLLTALVTQILAILVVDYFYESPYRFSFFTHALAFQTPNVSDGAQGLFMLIISLPTLFFLRRSKKTPKVEKAEKPKKIRRASAQTPAPQPVARTQAAKPKVSLSQRVQPVLTAINPDNWQITQSVSGKFKEITSKPKNTAPAKAVHINPSPAANVPQTPVVIKTTKKSVKKKSTAIKAAAPRKILHKQPNDVKLMGEEEHVCPYCLEKVNKSDKFVVCPECGTWHHQDCWDLTGSCGVAHRNEL
jgi:hypothetical protein